MTTLPDVARTLLDGKAYATIASLESDGSPQLTLVWVKREGDDVLFSTTRSRRKTENFGRDSRTALLAYDPENPFSYVEIRGRVTVTDDPEAALIHELAGKYTGSEEYQGETGDRIIVRITPEHVVAR